MVAVLFFGVFCAVATKFVYVRLTDFAAVLWRPALAAVVMAGVVEGLHDSGIASPILSLIRDSALGAVVFTALQLALWMMAGRPAGPERALIDRLRAVRGIVG